ncbi:MAG: hypothetical protein H0U76_11930 [Ktedonobacteraceae bacterium]|nr:hypothetical protein [Ktedonobacteraceae bacterium]
MTRAEKRAYRQQMEEYKIALIDQGCKTLRDAARRDHETFVQLIDVCMLLGHTFSDEVLDIAGKQREGSA